MKIQNPTNKPLQEVLTALEFKYPGSVIKKPFLTPLSILIPHDNFKFVLRNGKGSFKVDFVPPVLWIIGGVLLSLVLVSAVMSIIYGQLVFGIGGALWIVLGIFIVKAIFKSMNKAKFDAFYNDVQDAITRRDENSIF